MIVEGGAHVLSCGVTRDAAMLREGPAYVVGGNHAAYLRVRPILRATAAREQNVPCVAYAGTGVAGHSAQHVHDDLAAADLQLAVDAYELIVTGLGRKPEAAGEIFADWDTGELRSRLMETAARVLGRPDDRPFADHLAAELGVPAIPQAATEATGELDVTVPEIFEALYSARIDAYSRAFERLPVEHRASIASAWRAGSAIGGRFLNYVREAFEAEPVPARLEDDLYFAGVLRHYRPAWRRVTAEAARIGLAVPSLRAPASAA
ncbi:hypothetical protein OWR29_04080 [Actinoplanes sp. Pm04-4]|uniref:6-phosphogluconate dehydrogenase C-terminal domain-containing protein n=1 Tax=Paractinoplanes pyxinae TaxID=2997416 RepID=A0ABT4ASE6_9ACTN|nr:hypothetical protein [Actinoplanes pyxinae]MCY1137165.1 hypothetical protein [Actinoplanes pyxinae]